MPLTINTITQTLIKILFKKLLHTFKFVRKGEYFSCKMLEIVNVKSFHFINLTFLFFVLVV